MGNQTSHSFNQLMQFFINKGILLKPFMLRCTNDRLLIFLHTNDLKKKITRTDKGQFKGKGCQQ